MCDTDLDLELELEFAADEQLPDEPAIDGRYAGVAWGLAQTDVEAG
jgi:hypothetical protein